MAKANRIVSGIMLALCTLVAIVVNGAPKRGGNANNGDAGLRDEWIREVKKLESEPVADGFVEWTGLESVKGKGYLKCLTPSDLRGRYVVIVEIDDAKAVEQIRQTLSVRRLEFIIGSSLDWNFTTINRDVMVVYNLHGLSEADLAEKVVKDEILKQLVGFNYFGNVTFDGAPDPAKEFPYVYVMGPEGKEPLYKGKMDKSKTAKDIRAAIEKDKAALPAWRPWYGFLDKVKYTKGFDAAVNGGKSLDQVAFLLKKGIQSKNQEMAAESQRLYDALGRSKGDLIYRIKNERLDAPFAAMYDIEEVTRRFPSMKEKLASDSEKITRAHPNAKSVYKHYALYRKCADPAFHPKSKAEAKKLATELSKSKSILAKLTDDNDIAIQNLALTMPQHIDDLIAELPGKVMQK